MASLGRENLYAVYKTSGLTKDTETTPYVALKVGTNSQSHQKTDFQFFRTALVLRFSALSAGRAGEKFFSSHCLIWKP